MESGEAEKRRVPATGLVVNTKFSPVSLILIPLLIYIIWVLDTFLLEGSAEVFSHYQPWAFILYTIIANILMGIIVPVVCLKPAFLSGAVNMFQIGFRTLRRTIIIVVCTALSGYLVLIIFTPYDSQRMALLGIIAFLLPLAVASVMICWTIIGTHLQAYVRNYGAFISIIAGVLVTGLLFGLSFAAHSPPINQPQTLIFATGAGIASALYFFAVRDVWATTIFVTFALIVVLQGCIDQLYVEPISPATAFSAMLSVLALAGLQFYLSRRFITIRIPAGYDKK
ncbi:MAG: hypothetical protein A4E35_00484 [Methanoregula sp. PtaU1.Bin051]|nr:MAG: hypothetical protein A4E35_00484 [Methanoregula sp. PtaU1.Bin051]